MDPPPRPPSRPTLSLVVPATDDARASVQPHPVVKEDRLFPVACRVVPTDQWFTSRVDRTWRVIDLKLWLLSKALPPHTLPLPASFRPSSPVTFAPAPPPQSTPTSYHPALHPSAAPTHSTSPPPTSPPPTSPPPTSPPPTSPPPTSPPTSLISPFPTPNPLNTDPDYDLVDYASVDNDRLDLEDTDDASIASPLAIAYSFSTGAPSISGLESLRAHATARGYTASTPSIDPDFVTKAEAIARRWRVFSFTTGMLFADDLPLSEYNIFPFELLELHRAGAYVRLPRTVYPLPWIPQSSDGSEGHLTDVPQSTAHAYHSTTTHKPSMLPVDLDTGVTDDDEAPPPPPPPPPPQTSSPYAQPYFDGWAWFLSPGDSYAKDDGHHDAEGAGVRRMRRRARAKSEAARIPKSKDRGNRDIEWAELQRIMALGAPPSADDMRDVVPEKWRKRWVMVREGVLTVWKEKRDMKPEVSFEIASCMALHDAGKIPFILNSSQPINISNYTTESSSSTTAPRSQPIICARFRTNPMSRRERKKSQDFRKAHQRTPWLVLKLPDASTHEHLLRIFHRLAYAARHQNHNTPSARAYTRTLRTDFLPNPIPHPLALSFSEPSPVLAPDDESLGLPLESADETDDSTFAQRRRKGGAEEWMGLGRGLGVRFPEWREYILRRAIRAGQGFSTTCMLPPSTTASASADTEEDLYGFLRAERPYLGGGGTDSDSDSDVFSEAEWDGWAYDLDRPHAHDARARVGRPVKTPHGSPVSEPEHQPPPRVQGGLATTPARARHRSSTVSSPTAVDEPHARSVRGLMRGLSMRAGRDSIMRSLENALDFVEGK